MRCKTLEIQRSTLILLSVFASNVSQAQNSVAREWNEILLEAIRNDFARPTVHARNLYQHSIIAYDIWAAYEPTKDTYFLGKFFNGYYCEFSGINMPLNVEVPNMKPYPMPLIIF